MRAARRGGGGQPSQQLTALAAGTARETGLVPGAAANADGLLGLAPAGAGRIGVYGDSGCLDSSHQRAPCYAMLRAMLAYVTEVRPCCLIGRRHTSLP